MDLTGGSATLLSPSLPALIGNLVLDQERGLLLAGAAAINPNGIAGFGGTNGGRLLECDPATGAIVRKVAAGFSLGLEAVHLEPVTGRLVVAGASRLEQVKSMDVDGNARFIVAAGLPYWSSGIDLNATPDTYGAGSPLARSNPW